MIPLKLELKNFMAYRDADPLDLAGLHVVCLTGDNGAGKSTLLDAMTWALWGQARAKRDDELISQNTNEMRVALTFSEGKDVYQVVRTRKLSKAAKGKATSSTGALDFFIRDANNGWRTISETRTSETQDKIIRVLNLSYDTFVNSAFLKQGRADEFTLKPPAQRKELLAEILNLAVWQNFEAATKEKLSVIERELDKLKLDLDAADAEILRLPEYEKMLGEAETALRETEVELRKVEAEQTEIERQRERMKALRTQIAQAESRVKTLDADAQKLGADRDQHNQRLDEYRDAIRQRDEIERGFAQLEKARALNEQLNLKLTSLVDLNKRKSDAENKMADARRKLESERDAARRRVEEILIATNTDELKSRVTIARNDLSKLMTTQTQREELLRERAESSEKQGEARAQNELLRREMNEIKAQIGALEKVGAICPTCGRELSEEDRTRTLESWQVKGKTKGDQHRANDMLMKHLNERRAAIDNDIIRADEALRGLPALQREEAALEDRLMKAQELAAHLPQAQTALQQVEAVLSKNDYAHESRELLSHVEQELVALGYDASTHRVLRDETLPALSVFVERKSQLDRAEIGMQSEQRALDALALQEKAIVEKREREEREIADVRLAMGEAEKSLTNASEIESRLQKGRDEFFRAQRRVGEANQRAQACIAMQSTRERLAREFAEHKKKQSVLDELQTAFGKNGVPAMVIESALPELETSANELLGRMTNGRMNVRFETQRLTQKGDTSETLEIRISDELGERMYEMFSGGEAFRINFAIRIALSKMLAHRAGAPLQSLFIDEGFGTQDAQGRERLIEAIKAIENDFERIFVITHIDELRDAFPARIEVTKTTKGSVARIV
jgi:exonuclease SbcC